MVSTACLTWSVMPESGRETPLILQADNVTCQWPSQGLGHGTQTVRWTLTNNSDFPIVLEEVLTDCSCTVIKQVEKNLPASHTVEVVTVRHYADNDDRQRDYVLHVHYVIEGEQNLRNINKVLSASDLEALAE